MRHVLSAALGATLLVSTAVPALAHPTIELAPTLPTDLTHARTDNIDYLGRFPEHFGTAGGRLVGDTFFVTDPRGVFAYDVSTPASPSLLGSLPLPQSYTFAALAQEDPDTDGNLLLVDAATSEKPLGMLHVVDVSDPANMHVAGTAPVNDHTWNCVSLGDNGCAYAYGRTGWIVDLTDPTQPTVLETGWREPAGHGTTGSNSPYVHDFTEIRPGLAMAAGKVNVLLDTTDPANPVLLNKLEQNRRNWGSLGYHSVEWAQDGTSPIAVFGTEIAPNHSNAGTDCDGPESVIETWDATEVLDALAVYESAEVKDPSVVQAAQFEKLDAFDAAGSGLFLDGQAPGHVLYCAHWMEPHPDFDEGGVIATSYYDRGTRFVEAATDGTMREIGWIVPAEGYSGSVQWIGSDEQGDIAYIMDYRRGMEVVRIRPADEATTVVTTGVDLIAAGATVTPLGAPSEGGVPTSSAVAASFGVALAGVGLARRRRARAEA